MTTTDQTTVSTRAEFNALPPGTVVRRDADPNDEWDEAVVAERADKDYLGEPRWRTIMGGSTIGSESLALDGIPYTVLHNPAELVTDPARQALRTIANGRCSNNTMPVGACFTWEGRTADSPYLADRACSACTAHYGLTGQRLPVVTDPAAIELHEHDAPAPPTTD